MQTIRARLIAGLTLATLVACGNPPPMDAVTSVTIDGGDRTIVLGDAPTLTATVEATGTIDATVTWASSDEAVATIAGDGQVTSLALGTTDITATSSADPTKADTVTLTVDPPGALRWTRQFGTDGYEAGRGIAADGDGNVYVTGETRGDLDGSNAGVEDAFVRSYDRDGTLRWARQFGTSSSDIAYAIAADADGNVYAAGRTFGDLDGTNLGSTDAFVRSYDRDGNLRWTRQFGTSSGETAFGIAADADGNVYTTGVTFGDLDGSNAGASDGFVRSYDRDGTLRWTRQFGTSGSDPAGAIAVDANGNVYAVGYTTGDLEGSNAGGDDAYVRSYDSAGVVRWTVQFGTTDDEYALGITTDADGHVYATGYTTGDLEGSSAGAADAFVRAYDGDGNLRWARQFGSGSDDYAWGIATDTTGNVYTAGETSGDLEGSNAGEVDAFVRAYDGTGALRWTRQYGTVGSDFGNGIAADLDGSVYAVGSTAGDLEGSNAGILDVFIRSYGR